MCQVPQHGWVLIFHFRFPHCIVNCVTSQIQIFRISNHPMHLKVKIMTLAAYHTFLTAGCNFSICVAVVRNNTNTPVIKVQPEEPKIFSKEGEVCSRLEHNSFVFRLIRIVLFNLFHGWHGDLCLSYNMFILLFSIYDWQNLVALRNNYWYEMAPCGIHPS